MRKTGIDVLRILSAVAVLIIHVVSGPMVNSASVIEAGTVANLYLVNALMRWSVPAFFMITGYCLMNRPSCSPTYCLLHVAKFVGVLFTVGLFYAMLELLFSEGYAGVSTLLTALVNVISGELWDHMWYIYAVIGVYLVMPVIDSVIRQSRQGTIYLMALLFVFTILFRTLEPWIRIGVELPMGGYLFYVCLGGYVAKYGIRKVEAIVCYVAAWIAVAWIMLMADTAEVGYKDLPVCLMAIGIFVFWSSSRMVHGNKITANLAKCTWGIYLLHPFFINVAVKVMKLNLLSTPYYPFVLLGFAAVVFVVSLGTTMILRKIAIVKNLF